MEYSHLYQLVVSIYPPDLWDNVVDVEHRVIATQTHFRGYRQYHVHLFFIWLFYFFSGACRYEIDTCASLPHHTRYL